MPRGTARLVVQTTVGTARCPPPVTVIGVMRHGNLFDPVLPVERLALDTLVRVYKHRGSGVWEWHTDPGCEQFTTELTTTIAELISDEGLGWCEDCTLTARLHFAVVDTFGEDTGWTLITCCSAQDQGVGVACIWCEVLADVAAVAHLELLELHDAPHRGLLAQIPVEGIPALSLRWEFMLTTMHASSPDEFLRANSWARGRVRSTRAEELDTRELYLAGHNADTEVTDLGSVDRAVLVLADALDPGRAYGSQVRLARQLYLDVAEAVLHPAHP